MNSYNFFIELKNSIYDFVKKDCFFQGSII